ncbi:hypothetical protein D8S78_19810 [Natrialba swarupiae]|nr:hypothetical protein [Natrialba swarupiae]MCW8173234.1 hypothetical protein [Natrialba swarupiae]
MNHLEYVANPFVGRSMASAVASGYASAGASSSGSSSHSGQPTTLSVAPWARRRCRRTRTHPRWSASWVPSAAVQSTVPPATT